MLGSLLALVAKVVLKVTSMFVCLVACSVRNRSVRMLGSFGSLIANEMKVL